MSRSTNSYLSKYLLLGGQAQNGLKFVAAEICTLIEKQDKAQMKQSTLFEKGFALLIFLLFLSGIELGEGLYKLGVSKCERI